MCIFNVKIPDSTRVLNKNAPMYIDLLEIPLIEDWSLLQDKILARDYESQPQHHAIHMPWKEDKEMYINC